jgi:hypothetical protein
MKPLKLLTIFLLLGFTTIQAQVGINILEPDTTAILHIHSNTKGVLLPILSDESRNALGTAPAAEGLLVYDSVDKIYYFFNRTTKKWIALNPFQVNEETNAIDTTGDVRLAPNFRDRNVVIGGNNARAEAKLHVHGDIKSTNAIHANDSIWSPKINTTIGNINTVYAKVADVDTIRTRRLHVDTITSAVRANNIYADTIRASALNGRIPVGAIVMWDGPLNTVPRCWAVVDSMGGRFPVGAGNVRVTTGTQGISYSPRQIGGMNEVALTQPQMPRHNHSWTMSQRSSGANSTQAGDGRTYTYAGSDTQRGTPTITVTDAGDGQPHENRPPFYGVYFIRKMSNDNCY